MKHVNVALFAVHEGCPNMCSFCNQRSISGSGKKLTPADVHEAARTALSGKTDARGGEIAFFGGSFTLIERGYMLSLLEAAKQQDEAQRQARQEEEQRKQYEQNKEEQNKSNSHLI